MNTTAVRQTTFDTPGRIDIAPIVEAVRPAILEYEERIEAERTLPPELVEVLWEAGVLRFGHPREVGGLEGHPIDWLDLLFEISRINGSTGWVAMIQGAGGAPLERDVMEEIGRKGRWLIAGSFGRIGQARRVDGGYRVSGKWAFASGAPHATYLNGLAVLLGDDGNPVIDASSGFPQMLTAYFPANEVKIDNVWDGLGIRGSGSCGFTAEDVFVEDRFVVVGMTEDAINAKSFHDRPGFRAPFAITGHAAHSLGVAQAAIDEFIALAQRPPRPNSMRRAVFGHQQAFDIAIGKADSLVRAARAFAWGAVARVYEEAGAEGVASPEALRLMAQARLFATRSGRDATWMIFNQSGTDGVIHGTRLERCFRDASTAGQHVMYSETMYEPIGRYYRTGE